ncbi:hypothetical protein N8I77_009974 [Diaporthe amygdali]|uniref:Methyltransferase type 11 domain-containing protein n=1 Tax=Phomopsis amygdali TaxID=1214568 RepID=A0AAD9S6E6_PHOAM|nr:hypothetical protein N8I77_009974 [Diaporthe amygdali]
MGKTASYQPDALEEAHESCADPTGKREVKYPFAFKELDWEAYHRFRPLYPNSMFNMWLSYHQDLGNGTFQSAHDIGAGPGPVARRLVHRFDRVIVSDAGEANLVAAKHMLSFSAPPAEIRSKCTFIHSPAESVHKSIPPSSIDFASVAMAFHYFDAPNAIKSIAATLRPGGTLAAVTYGFMLKFPDHPALEKMWYRVASKESLRLIKEGLFPAAVKGLAAAMSGLDFVPLPVELFKPGARRIWVNVDEADERPLYFVDEDHSCWEPAPNRIGPPDSREYVKDQSWRRKADADWLRGFLASCQMGFGQQTWDTNEWKELEAAVLSAGRQVTVEWPVAMILATRNDKPVIW